jgi:hypothetical protein
MNSIFLNHNIKYVIRQSKSSLMVVANIYNNNNKTIKFSKCWIRLRVGEYLGIQLLGCFEREVKGLCFIPLCELKTSVIYIFGKMESIHTLNLDLGVQEE